MFRLNIQKGLCELELEGCFRTPKHNALFFSWCCGVAPCRRSSQKEVLRPLLLNPVLGLHSPETHIFCVRRMWGKANEKKRKDPGLLICMLCSHGLWEPYDTHRLSIILNIYGHDTLPFPMLLSMILSNGGEGIRGRSFSVILPLSHWHSSSSARKSQTEGPSATPTVLISYPIFFTPSLTPSLLAHTFSLGSLPNAILKVL